MCLVIIVLVRSCFSGPVKHAQTYYFAPFIFVYEFTVYFTDEVCKNDVMRVKLVAGLLFFLEACVGG